jgi:hypothetical protein
VSYQISPGLLRCLATLSIRLTIVSPFFFPLPLPILSCGGAWQWFGPVLSFINRHDVRLWSYINCDWDAFPMWQVITPVPHPSHVKPAVRPSSREAPHNAPTPRLTSLLHRALSPSLCT